MLMDGRLLASGTSLRARTCIVGTGMGALSVAHTLAKAGADVILIEAGPITAGTRDSPAIEIEKVGRPFRLSISRGLEVGGGSAFWHGLCSPLDESDFQQRSWMPHSGWPISRADLTHHYKEAWDFLCKGDRSNEAGDLHQAAQQFAAADILQNKIFQFRTPPFRGKKLVLDWCKRGLVRCVTHAAALQLIDLNGTALQLIVGSGEHTFAVQADMFVIAAGALETPRLLLNSQARSVSRSDSGLWWLGRNLIDHPAAYMSQVVFREPVPAHLFSGSDLGNALKTLTGFTIKPDIQIAQALPNHALFVRPGINGERIPNEKLMSFLGVRGIRDFRRSHFSALLTDRYIRWRVLHQRFKLQRHTRYGDLFFMTEQMPNPSSRVDLSDQKKDRFGYPVARVNWQLCGEDVDRFKRFHDLLMESLGRHSKVISSRKDEIGEWLESVSSAAHHLGTARMATSHATGVVDTNLKLFTMNNVWVCDGSVFPTAGNVNPSLTICALGNRLGSHLLSHRI